MLLATFWWSLLDLHVKFVTFRSYKAFPMHFWLRQQPLLTFSLLNNCPLLVWEELRMSGELLCSEHKSCSEAIKMAVELSNTKLEQTIQRFGPEKYVFSRCVWINFPILGRKFMNFPSLELFSFPLRSCHFKSLKLFFLKLYCLFSHPFEVKLIGHRIHSAR